LLPRIVSAIVAASGVERAAVGAGSNGAESLGQTERNRVKLRQVFAAAVLILPVWLDTDTARAAQVPQPQLAAKLGISVRQLQSIEARFNLSDGQLLGLPAYQLQLMLEDLEHPGVAKHQAEQSFQMLKLRDEHGQVPPDGLMRALEHRRHVDIAPDLFPSDPDTSTLEPTFGHPGTRLAGITSGGWTWLGPGNIGGRVRSILVHPTATNVLWCGGVDGGVWKTTNSGAGWFPLNDFMANLAIASMVMDPANPNVLYAGTGEPMYNGDSIRGAGIFKTTDGGTTWARLASTTNASFQYVARLAVDPNNSLVVLAATRSGIYRSTDGGTNWTLALGTEMLDIQFHPTDSSQAIASGYSDAFYSVNGGVSWTAATGFSASSGYRGGRIEVTYARSAPSMVYASFDSSGSNSGQVYVSADGGHTYALRNTGTGYLGGQGWYDNVIWVDPTTTNVLIVGGGPDLWRSTDGGATLTKISQWQSAPTSAHADHHAIVAAANYNGTTVRTVYFGNDGGAYRAADVVTVSLTSGWQSLNNNLGITQFYGGAGNANSGTIVGGTQDNGTLRYTLGGGPQGWTAMFGGDGGFSAADPADPNYFYGEYVYLQIHRSVNGGISSSYIYSGISDAGSSANFIAPFILDPNNPNTMLAGGNQLWRSVNVKAGTPTWSSIKPPTNSPISAIAVASANSDIIWVGHNNGHVYSTANGTAASPNWVRRDVGSPNLPNRYCERIAITPGNPNKVYVTFGGYSSGNVWRTLDGGLTWTDITGNLPPAPVNCLVLAPTATNTLYAATDVGIYGSTTDGTTWSAGNDGPANVAVDELFWMANKLVAVTHGRGMWSITPALGGPNLIGLTSIISGGNGNGLVDPNECDQLNVVLQNVGGTAATNVSGVLTTATPGVTIVRGSSAFTDLALGGGLGSNSTPFQLSTSPLVACGTPILVSLVLSYNGTNTVVPLSLPASASGYTVTAAAGAVLVPGTTDIGNHADDDTTTISLPFTWTFYGHNFTSAALSSNGNLQFASADIAWNNVCLPYGGFNYAIAPLWDDLRTDRTDSGIFTSITGSAPNRIFNIEWRATYYTSGLPVNFEIRLYESQSRFDLIYATVNGNGNTVTTGIQSDTGSAYYNYICNSSGLSDGLQLTFQQTCSDGGGPCPTGGDRFWTNTLGGDYAVAANWLNGLVAGPADNANFTNDASYQVTWTSDAAVEQALFNAPGGTVTQAVGSATWLVTSRYLIGAAPAAAGNVTHSSGNLLVTNGAGSAVLEIRRGTATLNDGLIGTDQLILTNSTGALAFNGGTLAARNATVNNGALFAVGDGLDAASYLLTGGTAARYAFANGMVVSSNATLAGDGTLTGVVTVASGGSLVPGTFFGTLVLSNSPLLDGSVLMVLSKNGGVVTNDQLQVAGPLAYGGSLTVSDLGPDPLDLGDTFPLFSASGFSGAFSAITLPPLAAGLGWSNQLLLNGSVTVVNQSDPTISGLARNGTNLVLKVTGGSPGGTWTLLTSMDVTLPLASWTIVAPGVFDWMGEVTLTNGIDLSDPQRYLRLRIP
jgi:hypothetical protein